MCVCVQECTAWGSPHTVTPCLEVQGPCWNQGRMPPKKLGVPSLWLQAASDKLPFAYLLLLSVISFKNSAWRVGKRAYKENKHIFVCSENGNCRIKGICMKSNITDELEAGLFFKSRGRPKGMHCAPLIYQLLECPHPLLCSPLFLHFPTLITYLHLQHSFPMMEISRCSRLAPKILLDKSR